MKKNYLKKILAVTMTIAISAGFAGCGNEGVDTIEAGSALKNEVNEEESIDEDSFNIDDVGEFTLRVGVCSGDPNQYLKVLDNHTNFLKDRGINLETTEFAAGINTIDAITIDQLDIGNFADYAGINRIGNTLADTDLRAFTMTGINKTSVLYVNPEHIKTAKDLEGAVLISHAGVVVEYDYGKLAETYDLDPDKLEYTNVSSSQEALALATSNSGDAYWAGKQVQPKFEEAGWVPFTSIVDVGAPMYCFLVANNKFLEEHKAEVAKYLAVSEEGFAYITEHLDEFAGWVEADLGLRKDLVISGWQESTHDYGFPQEAYEDLYSVEEWCYKNGNFPTQYDPADFINTDALALYKPDAVTWERK